jgi:hypothetical protein
MWLIDVYQLSKEEEIRSYLWRQHDLLVLEWPMWIDNGINKHSELFAP